MPMPDPTSDPGRGFWSVLPAVGAILGLVALVAAIIGIWFAMKANWKENDKDGAKKGVGYYQTNLVTPPLAAIPRTHPLR
jgi:hypothetical protein